MRPAQSVVWRRFVDWQLSGRILLGYTPYCSATVEKQTGWLYWSRLGAWHDCEVWKKGPFVRAMYSKICLY